MRKFASISFVLAMLCLCAVDMTPWMALVAAALLMLAVIIDAFYPSK